MHQSVMEFVAKQLSRREIEDKRVLEVGSYNVNGSARDVISPLFPKEYLGVDMRPGPAVDQTWNISEGVPPGAPYDVVITAEMLEHVDDWRSAINNLKLSVAPGGILLVTTRSQGFPLHEYPGDFWRFGVLDMARIFSDMDLRALELDPQVPGVFVKAIAPDWSTDPPRSLDGIDVYAMPGGR